MQSKWNEVKTLVPQRDNTLQDELKKQENNEALRRQFAEKSNQVSIRISVLSPNTSLSLGHQLATTFFSDHTVSSTTSSQVGPWIERQMDAVAAIGMGMQGSLEEQLGRSAPQHIL